MQLPLLDLQQPGATETATFSIGCFWSPDALFGCMKGVVSTRVGYAGGSTENPTYRNMADHIETLQLAYDPEQISYQSLLDFFFEQRNPFREPWKRQYAAAVYFHNPEQQQLIYQKKEKLEQAHNKRLETLIYPYSSFYLAEERHQKYKLQRHPKLLEEYRTMYPKLQDFIDSTAAARVNGYLYGCGSCERLLNELPQLGLSPSGQKLLLDTVTDAEGIPCAKSVKQQSS